MTPQEQAEAMARELWSKPRTFDETVTALSKLIAENERLKKEAGMTQERYGKNKYEPKRILSQLWKG